MFLCVFYRGMSLVPGILGITGFLDYSTRSWPFLWSVASFGIPEWSPGCACVGLVWLVRGNSVLRVFHFHISRGGVTDLSLSRLPGHPLFFVTFWRSQKLQLFKLNLLILGDSGPPVVLLLLGYAWNISRSIRGFAIFMMPLANQ